MALTYKQAGVDVDAGDRLVERIAPFARATRTAHVLGKFGGFAGLCSVPSGVDDPVLVSGADGVGSKLKVAFATGVHDTIGRDLVAMCVNDILTCGAHPLFFLDYFATSKLDIDVAAAVVRGIAGACKDAGAALLGGETSEVPGMYAEGEYDLAGFAVGIVGRKKLVDGSLALPGDVAIGLPSSGLHSNGYTLARAVLFDELKLDLGARPPELAGRTVAEALLAPTLLYTRHVRALEEAHVPIRAMCHVTGGGIPGNLPRVLPEGLGVRIDTEWPLPAIYHLLMRGGHVTRDEMRRVFNVGIGFVVIVPEADLGRALGLLAGIGGKGEEAWTLGRVVAFPQGTAFQDRVAWPEARA